MTLFDRLVSKRVVLKGSLFENMIIDHRLKVWFDEQTVTEWRNVIYATNGNQCGVRFPAIWIYYGHTDFKLHN